MVPGAQSIAVTNEEFLIIKNELLGFEVNGNVQFFLKIIFHPHVVVAHKKIQWNAFISKIGQRTQQTHISFRHYSFIFIPEIEHVAYDKNMRGIVLNRLKKINYDLFPLKAGGCVR